MFENQAFKSFEIEKIDDSRFSAQFAPVFEQEREDFNSENPDDFGSQAGVEENAKKSENEIIQESEKDQESATQNINHEEISQNEDASNQIILENEKNNIEEKSQDQTANNQGTLSEIIQKAVDLGHDETKAGGKDQASNIFSRNSSESKFEAGSFKQNQSTKHEPTSVQNNEQPTRNQPPQDPTELQKSPPKDSIKESHTETIENSGSFYPTESRGGEEHNVFQSEKRGETIELKVGANGSEEDIKIQGEGSGGDVVRESGGILASAGSFGNGLTNHQPMVN